jgi:hypothetical protein
MNPTLKQILIGAGMILFGALVTYLVTQARGRREAKDATDKRISELERQLGIVGAQVAPFNTAFQTMLIKQLTHSHAPVMDALMAKLGSEGVPPTITEAETVELAAALRERASDPLVGEYEACAAQALLPVTRMAEIDKELQKRGKVPLVDFQVVGRLDIESREE